MFWLIFDYIERNCIVMKTKSSTMMFVCILILIIQGVLTYCFDFFLVMRYSTDAPAGFYNTKYVVYFSIATLLLVTWGYLTLKIKSPKAMMLPVMPCLAWLIGGSLKVICHNLALGITHSILHLIATLLQCFSTCPLACINVIVKDTPIASLISQFTYVVFLVIYFIVNRKRIHSTNKEISTTA